MWPAAEVRAQASAAAAGPASSGAAAGSAPTAAAEADLDPVASWTADRQPLPRAADAVALLADAASHGLEPSDCDAGALATVVLAGGGITTTGALSIGENSTLLAGTTLTGNGVSLGGTVDGAFGLTVAACTGTATLGGAVGGSSPLTSFTVSGANASLRAVKTSGAQAIAAASRAILSGKLTTAGSNVSITAPVTLASSVVVDTGSGAGTISLVGSTSTVNGAHALTLSAGTGDVALGGALGGSTRLSALTVSGRNLPVPVVGTVGDDNQSYTALNDLTLTQSRTLGSAATFTADVDGDVDVDGSFVLPTGVALTMNNAALTIAVADLDLAGSSSISAGSGLVTLAASAGRNLALGGTPAAGQMTVSGSELQRITVFRAT